MIKLTGQYAVQSYLFPVYELGIKLRFIYVRVKFYCGLSFFVLILSTSNWCPCQKYAI